MRCVLPLIVLIAAAHGQDADHKLVYVNSNPPGCGSFHVRRIQGTVTDQGHEPIKHADVAMFDDTSQKLLGTAKTDEAGRFSIRGRWHGRLRVVFYSPGFWVDDWAVTIVNWPG